MGRDNKHNGKDTVSGPVAGNAQYFEKILFSIVESSEIGVYDWYVPEQRIVFSPEWERIAGYEPGTMPQTVDAWQACLHPDDTAFVGKVIRDHWAGLAPHAEAEFRMVRPDGTVVWVQGKGQIMKWDVEDSPLRFVGILQDISRLKRAETQLDYAAAMAGLGLWGWDIPANRITYDRTYYELLGYAQGELDGSFDDWEALLHPDDIEPMRQALAPVLDGTAPEYQQEVRLRHKDGHYLWMLDNGWVVARDAGGKPTQLLGGHLNINRQKQGEARLQEALDVIGLNNARLQTEIDEAIHNLAEAQRFSTAMFEANPYINLIFDDQLKLVDCNPAAIEYFGYTAKRELLDKLLDRLVEGTPRLQPDASPTIPLSTRFEYAIEHEFLEFESEFLLDGKRVPLRITLKKIVYKDSFAIAAYMVDMQTLREARNELLRQDFLLRQVNRAATRLMAAAPEKFEMTVLSVLRTLGESVDANRMHIWQNYTEDGQPMSRQLYLWDLEAPTPNRDALPKVINQMGTPEWHKRLAAKKSINLRAADIPAETRERLFPRSTRATLILPIHILGEYWGFIWLEKSANDELFSSTEEKVIQSGGIITVSAILRNQINSSLIQAREAALASDKAKSDFLSRMSHEIRTPMNAIIGMTSIAQKMDDLPRIRYSLGKIEDASQQLLNIINDILDMSKIESGKLEITPTEFDFEAMMKNVFNVIQVRLDEKKQNFTFSFETMFTRQVICDELPAYPGAAEPAYQRGKVYARGRQRGVENTL